MKKLADRFWLLGVGAAVLVAAYVYKTVPLSEARRLDKQCLEFGAAFLKDHKDLLDKNSKKAFFYSKRLDTCVMTEMDELGNKYAIYDIKLNYLKRDSGDSMLIGSLFYCDEKGVDNVVLEKAEKFSGHLSKVPYSEYLDDGEGGPARAQKPPAKRYGRARCEALFNKKLREIE